MSLIGRAALYRGRCARRVVVAASSALVLLVSLTGAARASDRVYWGNANVAPTTISFAALDGSGGSDLATGSANLDKPLGTAIDPASGKIYWANSFGHGISFANLDGTGGGDLNTGLATVSNPEGVAVDPVGGKIYWANNVGNKISFARLDGTGGGDLKTGGATVSGPSGVALDGAGRIYWANFGNGGKISVARLDGSGGGDLNTKGATVSQPAGVALDLAAGMIYWANVSGNSISFARLDSTGGGDLPTGSATVSNPVGVALDPVAGKIYWASSGIAGSKLSFAKLDGSGGGDLPTGKANTSSPAFPSLLESPRAVSPPSVTGGTVAPTTLSCVGAGWAPDLGSAFLFRAPHSFSYQFTRNGTDIPGATQSTYQATTPGSYACRVTATNAAGSASQSSAALTVGPGKPSIGRVKINHRKRTAKFFFKAAGVTRFRCALVKRSKGQHKPKAKFKPCKSPKAYRHLKPGRYIFEVRATSPAGAGPIASRTVKV